MTTAVGIHGATQRQIDFWVARGYLQPDRLGSGVAREWSQSEIRVAQLMARLVFGGFTPADASVLARQVLRRRSRSAVRLTVAPGIVVEITEEQP